MKAAVEPNSVSVRDLEVGDIPFLVQYWFHSPAGYVESMGVDPAKLPTEEQMEQSLKEKCRTNVELGESKLNALVILYNGRAIGIHTMFPYVEGNHGVFHAHIWDPTLRGREIGIQSYIKAADVFMRRFNLERIVYKTPVQNVGAIRVKEKIGIRFVGEEVVELGLLKEGTLAKVFELTRSELQQIMEARAGQR